MVSLNIGKLFSKYQANCLKKNIIKSGGSVGNIIVNPSKDQVKAFYARHGIPDDGVSIMKSSHRNHVVNTYG